MTEEEEKAYSMDVHDSYRCDGHGGVPVPLGHPLFRPNVCEYLPHGRHIEIRRIGLLLSCSDKDILKRLIADAQIILNIDQLWCTSKPFSAFIDKNHSKDGYGNIDLSDDTLLKSHGFAVASSIPVDPVISIAKGQPYDVSFDLPKDLVKDLRLKEYDVFMSKTKYWYRTPLFPEDWFIRIGVRLIGKSFREYL